MNQRRRDAATGCAVTGVIVLLLVAAFGWFLAYRTVDAGQVALHFGGGAFDSKNGKFKAVHGPGRHNMGLGDHVFSYPDTVRNYVFAPEGQDPDAPPVPVATKGTKEVPVGPQVAMTGQFLFHLNTGDALGDFHRRFGVRYKAWQGFDDPGHSDGWQRLLDQTFKPAAESAITAAARTFTVDDLSRQDKIDAFEAAVSERTTETLRSRMGGSFFCGPDYDRNTHPECSPLQFQMKPVLPPADLANAATRLAVANKNVEIAKAEGLALDEAKKHGLTGMAYVANECRKDPSCAKQMIFVGGGAAVSVGR